MSIRKLTVIPEPKENTRTVFIQEASDNPTPYIIGKGDIDLVCGKCSAVLAEGTEKNQTDSIVFYCNGCDSYNDTALYH